LAYASIQSLKDSGIRVQLHELQNISYDKVPLWLNASTSLLLTSIHEGSPTIVKEALACNVPVVSVDVGDVAERVNDIAGCYLAKPSPEDLASKILMVINREERIRGRDSVQHLSLKSIARSLKQFYAEVQHSWNR